MAGAIALLLAGCVPTPRPQQRPAPRPAPTPPPARPAPPAPPPQPPKPATAAQAGVVPGPPVASLGLTDESARLALAAFRLSCPGLIRRADRSGLTRGADWQAACDDAMGRLDVDGPAFFAQRFETARIGDGAAFATGYYEPEIAGSRDHLPGYDVPVYRRPPDLIEADPGDLTGQPTGRKQRGRIDAQGAFRLYYERSEIEDGVLANKGLEIGWARDPYEVFFLQIQGSGRLIGPDGTVTRIGYDSQNGRDYVGIGSSMRQQGLIGEGTGYATSMQGIIAWLHAHPDEARGVLDQNKSYVFFREITGPGPIGAMGVQVVGRASVAADPLFVPLGAPIFLTLDRAEASGLWVAQDTGGAIKGANRVDTFWGAGEAARTIAGGMSGRGQALLLLPRGTLARLVTARATGGGDAGSAPQR